MKALKLLAAGTLALAVAGTASAVTPTDPVHLYLIGSTAFRAATHQAIENAMGGAGHYTLVFNGDNDTSKGFNVALFYGTIAGTECIVKTFWTGSAAGVIELTGAQPFTNSFMADSVLTPVALNSVTSVASGSYATDASDLPTVANADCPASEVAKDLATAVGAATPGSAAYIAEQAVLTAPYVNAGVQVRSSTNAASGNAVAEVTFEWCVSPSSDGFNPITNVTQQQAAALLETGYLPLSVFTGNPADFHNFVFLVGRNEDSGTRNCYASEPQTGFGQNIVQVAVNGTNASTPPAGAGSLTSIALFPKTGLFKEPTITWNKLGHSGYYGGGDVRNALLQTCPNTSGSGLGAGLVSPVPSGWDAAGTGTSKCYLIGALGIADIRTGLTICNYNGVPYTAATTQTGQYTFWNYEHCYYLSSGTNAISTGDSATYPGGSAKVADAIADQLFTADATFDAGHGAAGVLINSSVLVGRTQGGAPPVQNY